MDIDERIASIRAELHYLDNLKSRLISDRHELVELELEKNRLEKALQKETQDVDRLEKTTIVSLFYSLMGSREIRLEKEKEEAFQASLAYHRVLNNYEIKKQDIDKTEERLSHETELINEIEQLQIKRAELFPEYKEKIDEYREQLNQYTSLLKEIEEAIQAGYILFNELDDVSLYLKDAKNWGIYDMMGGDMIGTLLKHSSINKAQKRMLEVQNKIKNFEKELKDIKISQMTMPNITTFQFAFDFIFDNFFTDYFVQSKINASYDDVKETMHQVETIIKNLNERKMNINDMKTQVHKKLRDIT